MAIVDLVSGFLGAGKTTFIRSYAAWLKKRNTRVVVVENEFGLLNIDSALLRQENVDVMELSGGCICCGLKKDFRKLLVELGGNETRIIVEPSGIFNPRDFFEVMAEPEVAALCRIGAVVAIVDPFSLAFPDGTSRELISEQVNCSGAIVLSKTTGMAEKEIDASVTATRKLLDTSHNGDIATKPWEDFTDGDFSALSANGSRLPEKARQYMDHAALYDSLIIHSNRALGLELLNESLSTAYNALAGMIRIKGFVPNPDGGFWEVNCTRHNRGIREIQGIARSFIVTVGCGLDRKLLESLFRNEAS